MSHRKKGGYNISLFVESLTGPSEMRTTCFLCELEEVQRISKQYNSGENTGQAVVCWFIDTTYFGIKLTSLNFRQDALFASAWRKSNVKVEQKWKALCKITLRLKCVQMKFTVDYATSGLIRATFYYQRLRLTGVQPSATTPSK